jgi:hypothetical protein
MPARRWDIPEGLKVLPDGSWRVGDVPVLHPRTLRHFKSHLVLEGGRAFVVDGAQRMAVQLEGPPLMVTTLVLDQARGEARAVLDDGSEEPVRDSSLTMNRDTGRFECAVREGRGRALLSRGAHQTLLEHVVEEDGVFFLRVGDRRFSVRT